MHDGNRGDHTKTGLIAGIFVAALIAAASIGWGLWQSAEYERQADNHAREYAAYTDNQIRQSCLSLPPIYQKDCAAKARNEQRDNERNERDLVAQRQSALWAYIMGAAAVIGMGLSVIGVVLVWTTFAETKRANSIALAQNRAWLNFEMVECKISHKRGKLTKNPKTGKMTKTNEIGVGDPAIIITVAVKNTGNAPAYDIRWISGKLKGQWKSRGEPSVYEPFGRAFYEKVATSESRIPVLMPGEFSTYAVALHLNDEWMTPDTGYIRAFPKWAMFVEYRGSGIDHFGETGKVLTFFDKDGRLFRVEQGVSYHGKPMTMEDDIEARHAI